jgi:hypothetical protein
MKLLASVGNVARLSAQALRSGASARFGKPAPMKAAPARR